MANDLDGAWKEAIQEFILDLIDFFSPELHSQIDQNRQVIFLDKELHELAVSLENEIGLALPENGEVDVLTRLPLLGSTEVWILLHVEVQGGGGKVDINFRMFKYQQLINIKHHTPVIALLIATEPLKTEHTLGQYQWREFGTAITYQYNVIQAYELNEDDLLQKSTPFALMLLAAKRAYKLRKDESGKIEFAKTYYELLLSKNYSRKTSGQLVVFMEKIARLKKS